MPDKRDDLRATEESIIDDAERLRNLESEKAALNPGDPKVDLLSEKVVRIVEGLDDKAAIQRRLSAEIETPS
jgi:hypothetical protein